MTYVGIDVAEYKHDCYIVNSDGEILVDVQSEAPDISKVKVGLEATGHYNYNILDFSLTKALQPLSLTHSIPICFEINQSTPDENRSRGCAYLCNDIGFRYSPHILHSNILPP